MVDLLIKNARFIITEPGKVLQNTSIAIDEGRIVEVGKAKGVKADRVLDASDCAVIPGLINCHAHAGTSFLRGLVDDRKPLDFLENILWPGLDFCTPHNQYLFSLVTFLESIRAGTTCIVNQFIFPESICKALSDSGLRGIVAPKVHDDPALPYVDAEDPDEQLKNAESTLCKWNHARNDTIRVWFGEETEYYCSPEHLKKVRELATKHKTGIFIHLSEAKEVVSRIRRRYGKHPIKFVYDLGILGPDVMAAHCLWLTEREISMLSETKTKIVHTPVCNMKIAAGLCPVPELMAHGLNVSLGTDGNCTNNNQDMFDVMKFSALLHKFNKLNPTVLPAETVFRMATLNGATACAWNNEIGTIKQGKRADLALVNIRQPHFFPVDTTTLVPNLVYSAHGHDVESCIVNGKLLMENRVITMLDEMKILEKAQDEAEEFLTSRRHVFTALTHREA